HDLAAQVYHIKEPQKLPLTMSPDEAKRLGASPTPAAATRGCLPHPGVRETCTRADLQRTQVLIWRLIGGGGPGNL
ncbi:MAG: hypothetical protein WCD75_06395, partial [Rhodoplanes sp.]